MDIACTDFIGQKCVSTVVTLSRYVARNARIICTLILIINIAGFAEAGPIGRPSISGTAPKPRTVIDRPAHSDNGRSFHPPHALNSNPGIGWRGAEWAASESARIRLLRSEFREIDSLSYDRISNSNAVYRLLEEDAIISGHRPDSSYFNTLIDYQRQEAASLLSVTFSTMTPEEKTSVARLGIDADVTEPPAQAMLHKMDRAAESNPDWELEVPTGILTIKKEIPVGTGVIKLGKVNIFKAALMSLCIFGCPDLFTSTIDFSLKKYIELQSEPPESVRRESIDLKTTIPPESR